MNKIFNALILILLLLSLSNCNGQNNSISTQRETLSKDFDKLLPFYFKMPSKLFSEDRSPGWKQNGTKILLTGTVYEFDGKTPASGVILYYYQTNVNGIYSTNPKEPRNMPKNKLGQTHGHIRGWVKTNADGEYSIYTIKPGTYPSRDEPAHIHISVKEPDLENHYYIDDFVFDNDPMLTSRRRNAMENRGGSGVIRFVEKDEIQVGERNMILGLNVPNYPKKSLKKYVSGKKIGEDVSSFTPFHAFGPDKGTKTCPICKYGWYHGILYFVGNDPDWIEIRKWLVFLDSESIKREKYLKSYFVYGNDENFNKEDIERKLEELGKELQLKNIALTFVPSLSDKTSEIYLNKINQYIANTFLIYRRSNIIGKYTNLKPTQGNFDMIKAQLNQQSEYFKLPKSSNK
ncbi:intradiol ring-cleavage dioxygenase [Sungkyunkwania multivorans]|uniref:Intradiol ring-cleavage dioxygenase n=1 Tax=Sungkyunkwania multivorans TaxID=1173618 RepID=A0ABW3D4N5_9FLAO